MGEFKPGQLVRSTAGRDRGEHYLVIAVLDSRQVLVANRQLSSEGKSIMIFSSELPEIMNICDSIYLLFDGNLKAAMRNGDDVDSEKIGRAHV